MNPQNKWLKVVGVVLNVLIAALILFAGVAKVAGSQDMAANLAKAGLGDRMLLIGWGEIITAVLLVLPWTSPLGGLLTSGFWGGVICIQMAHNQDFIFPSVLLVLTWLGCYLRGSLPLFWMKSGGDVSRITST